MTEESKIEENAVTSSLNKMYSQSQQLSVHYNQISEELASCENIACVADYVIEFFQSHDLRYARQNFNFQTEAKLENLQNVVGIFHTRRSNNFECELIAFDLNPISAKVSVPFALSFIEYYNNPKINYLSRDVIFLGYDSRGKYYGNSVKQFLDEYQSINSTIPRCGVIRQGINIDLEANFSQLYLKAMGFDARMPDRDFFLGFNKLFQEAFSEGGFMYTETSTALPFSIGNFLQKKFQYVCDQLKITFSRTNLVFRNLKHLIVNMATGLHGEVNDAHSQMISHGIQALTIKGKKDKSGESASQFSNKVSSLFNVVDQGMRSQFNLEEQYHAGSTLYYPVVKNEQITIQALPLGIILVFMPSAIQFLSLHYKKKDLPGNRSYYTLIAKMVGSILNALLFVFLPRVSEQIADLIFSSPNHPNHFCIQWNSLNSPDLNKLITIFAILAILSKVIFNFVIEKILCQRLLGFSAYKGSEEKLYQSASVNLFYSILGFVYLLQNAGTAYFYLVPFSPLYYFAKPLFPSSWKDGIRSLLSLTLLFATGYLLYLSEIDFVNELKRAVITQECYPSHTILFFSGWLFNAIWNLFELLLS